MKNIFLSMLFAFALSAQTQAQVSMEIKAGPVVSNWRGAGLNTFNSIVGITGNFISRKPYTGFYAGSAAEIPVSENITLQAGLQYSQTGTVLQGDLGIKVLDILNLKAKASMIQQTIEIPLLVKVATGKGFSVMGGPIAGYHLNNKLHVKATALVFNMVNKTYDMNEYFEKFNMSLAGGLQYRLENGLGIQAIYTHNLTGILKDRDAKVYTQSARIGLSYIF
ncbi:MAG: porin family protein [Ferruginibacter sp.]